MKISRTKVELAMARKKMKVVDVAKVYGATPTSIRIILKNSKATPAVVGRLAEALGVDVTEIIED